LFNLIARNRLTHRSFIELLQLLKNMDMLPKYHMLPN